MTSVIGVVLLIAGVIAWLAGEHAAAAIAACAGIVLIVGSDRPNWHDAGPVS
jgi:hypothetical protein